MEKVYRLYIADRITADGFGFKYRPLEERKRQLDEEIPAVQGEVDFMKISHLSSSEVIAEAQDLERSWPRLTHDEKRKIVEAITEKITVGKDELEIRLCYLPSLSEITSKKQRSAPAR